MHTCNHAYLPTNLAYVRTCMRVKMHPYMHTCSACLRDCLPAYYHTYIRLWVPELHGALYVQSTGKHRL